MQEQHQHGHRQRAADEDVVLHQVDGRVDVLGFVVDLRELQAARIEHFLVELGHRCLQAVHHVEHVGVGLARGVDGDARFAEAADEAVGLLVAEAHLGHVADEDRRAVADRQQLVLDLLRRAELAQRAHDPAALAFPEVAGRRVLVLAAEHVADVGEREPAGGQLLRIDDHLQLVFQAAERGRLRHAGHALEAGFDLVLGEAAQLRDVEVRPAAAAP